MSDKNKTREQAVKPTKTFNRSTVYLAIPLTFFVTLCATAIAMYFVTISMIGDQKASVVSDMQLVQKTVSK